MDDAAGKAVWERFHAGVLLYQVNTLERYGLNEVQMARIDFRRAIGVHPHPSDWMQAYAAL